MTHASLFGFVQRKGTSSYTQVSAEVSADSEMDRTSIHSEQHDATDDRGSKTRGKRRERRGKEEGATARQRVRDEKSAEREEREGERKRQKLIDEKSENDRRRDVWVKPWKGGGGEEGGSASGSLTITKALEMRENHWGYLRHHWRLRRWSDWLAVVIVAAADVPDAGSVVGMIPSRADYRRS